MSDPLLASIVLAETAWMIREVLVPPPKGVLVDFPYYRVSPRRDLGEDAEVLTHGPVEGGGA